MSTEQSLSTAKRLLLVDDDRLALSTLATGLARVGYRVTTAESVEEAEADLSGGPAANGEN